MIMQPQHCLENNLRRLLMTDSVIFMRLIDKEKKAGSGGMHQCKRLLCYDDSVYKSAWSIVACHVPQPRHAWALITSLRTSANVGCADVNDFQTCLQELCQKLPNEIILQLAGGWDLITNNLAIIFVNIFLINFK